VPDRSIAEALLMHSSMPPKRSAAAPTASATALPSRMSPTIGSALPPAASISSAAAKMVPGSRGLGSAVFAIS
jgi:hypothetical protein